MCYHLKICTSEKQFEISRKIAHAFDSFLQSLRIKLQSDLYDVI